MGHEDLRALLEVGGDGDERQLGLGREEVADHVAAHEEVELAEQQQEAAVRLRAARHDGHVEAVLLVGAVGERLIEAAGRRVGQPVGAKAHLVEREGGRREAEEAGQSSDEGLPHAPPPNRDAWSRPLLHSLAPGTRAVNPARRPVPAARAKTPSGRRRPGRRGVDCRREPKALTKRYWRQQRGNR